MMGRIGSRDTDADALEKRVAAYTGTKFDEWVMTQLRIQPNETVLELGCGTGKQTIPIAKRLAQGHITAIDTSKEALKILRLRAESSLERMTLIQAEMDDVRQYGTLKVDCAFACYSLYYASNPARVFNSLYHALKPQGRLFFCGPGFRNNAELKALMADASGKIPEETEASVFMVDTGVALTSKLFHNVSQQRFRQRVSFDSTEGLMAYWKSHNLYDEQIEESVANRVSRHFAKYGRFKLTKVTVGIGARKCA